MTRGELAAALEAAVREWVDARSLTDDEIADMCGIVRTTVRPLFDRTTPWALETGLLFVEGLGIPCTVTVDRTAEQEARQRAEAEFRAANRSAWKTMSDRRERLYLRALRRSQQTGPEW